MVAAVHFNAYGHAKIPASRAQVSIGECDAFCFVASIRYGPEQMIRLPITYLSSFHFHDATDDQVGPAHLRCHALSTPVELVGVDEWTVRHVCGLSSP